MGKIELLSPAGDMNKLKTALYFGADAVYVGGKTLSLRALAGNFTEEEIAEAVRYVHERNKKIYVTVNIFAKNSDVETAEKYFVFLQDSGVDGAIISDPGLVYSAKKVAPGLSVSLSTQANTLNYRAAEFWKSQGVNRVILARELSFKEIKDIHEKVNGLELEAFVHGAMCISYSGRCLLSDYRSGRSSNRGECVQACRWNYEIREKNSDSGYMKVEEDGRGSYILNSKDLNLIEHIDGLADAGVVSFKIEGRMKSEYYIATVVNAYRRALDAYYAKGAAYKNDPVFALELKKTAHRDFTTAYCLGDNADTVNYSDSQSKGTYKFIATVLEKKDGYAVIEMRNRFRRGDMLEVLSPSEEFNKTLNVDRLTDMNGNTVEDARIVQQKLKLFTDLNLSAGDILRAPQ